jgi:hypothetical protein
MGMLECGRIAWNLNILINIKQLLDEAEHDIKNIQTESMLSAEAKLRRITLT